MQDLEDHTYKQTQLVVTHSCGASGRILSSFSQGDHLCQERVVRLELGSEAPFDWIGSNTNARCHLCSGVGRAFLLLPHTTPNCTPRRSTALLGILLTLLAAPPPRRRARGPIVARCPLRCSLPRAASGPSSRIAPSSILLLACCLLTAELA